MFTVSLFSTILLRCFPGLNSIMRLIFSILLIATALLISSCDYFGFSSARKLDHPLVMIGVDGGEWDVIETLMEKGELPNLAKLIDTGISGHLINPGPATSPPVWTTFATGQFPREHGILEHVYPYDDSAAKKPVDSSMRLKPALWNLASGYGLKSTVMGYFVSWPAETINGTIVSDRAFQGLESAVSPAEDTAAFEEVFAPLQWGEGRQEALDYFRGKAMFDGIVYEMPLMRVVGLPTLKLLAKGPGAICPEQCPAWTMKFGEPGDRTRGAARSQLGPVPHGTTHPESSGSSGSIRLNPYRYPSIKFP